MEMKKVTFKNGVYFGEVDQNNIPNGKGSFVYLDSSFYTGQVVNGLRSGNGKIVGGDGTTYEGQWLDDVPNGSGTMHGSDGSAYTGDFAKGMREGKGKYVDNSGNIYEGSFKDNLFNGEGVLVFANGDKYKNIEKTVLKEATPNDAFYVMTQFVNAPGFDLNRLNDAIDKYYK